MKNVRLSLTRRSAVAMMAMAVMMGSAPSLRAANRAVPGEERRWALDFRTRLEQPGAARPAEVHFQADWISTVSAVRPGEYDAALQLANLRMVSNAGPAQAGQVAELVRKLSRRYWATYRENGLLVALHFYQDTDPGDRNLLQMIATESQFVQAPADRASWTATERDGAGEYEAQYDRGTAGEVTKRRLRYGHADAEPGHRADSVRIEVEESLFRFTLDGEGGTVALDGKSRVRIAVSAGRAGQIAAVTEIHLTGLRQAQSQEAIGSLARALPQVVSSPIRTHRADAEQVRARLDAQLLDGRSTESLLDAAFAKPNQPDQLLDDRLAALFRRRPEAAMAAVNRLRKSGPNSKITDALGAAGSPAAITALEAVAGDRSLAGPLRVDALSAFIPMQHPSIQAMRAPIAWWEDDDFAVASAARIASGSLAHAGRSTRQAEAESINAALVAHYQQARDTRERTELLAAMGNSAGKRVAGAIEGALKDPQAEVRRAAARALRLADGPEVEGLLAAAITSDQDAGVRSAALFAAGFRRTIGRPLGEALLHAAKFDPAEEVRTGAISLMRRHADAVPQVAETLEWIARHDPLPGVRGLAQEARKGL